MASKFITLTGTAYWARVFPENKDKTGYDNELTDIGGQYVVNMILEDDQLDKLVQSNSLVPSFPSSVKDEDGNDVTAYRFKRLHEKYSRAGELLEWASGAPEIVDEDGNKWDLEERGLIGNGSTVEVTLCVYQAGKTYGTRLEKLKVVDHVKAPESVAA